MLFSKPKPKSRSRRKRVYGGAIFASVVFMVLSMMVILQNEKILVWQTSLQSNGRMVNQAQDQLQLVQNDLFKRDQDLNSCWRYAESQGARFESIIATTDLDQRWWDWKVNGDVGIVSPKNIEFIVHRPSPSGQYVAIAVGDKDSAEPRRALGFFVLDRNVYKGNVYWVPFDGFIRNIQWQRDTQLTFDLVSTKPGEPVRQKSFLLPSAENNLTP